jgi:hypothetical protein
MTGYPYLPLEQNSIYVFGHFLGVQSPLFLLYFILLILSYFVLLYFIASCVHFYFIIGSKL